MLAEDADESAAQVAPSGVGDHVDLDARRRSPPGCDVLTFDHEHVPTEHLRALEAEGIPVRPGSDALVHAQDKTAMRRAWPPLGIPCPAWAVVTTVARAGGVRRAPAGRSW